jgi:hypothetical protein
MNRIWNSGAGISGRFGRRLGLALCALLLVLLPYLCLIPASYCQTEPPETGAASSGSISAVAGDNLSERAKETDATSRYFTDADLETSLVQQAAEQNKTGVIEEVERLLRGELGVYNETYFALHQWFSDDWISNLFANIGQLFGKWLTEFLCGWVADTVRLLTAFLKIFVLNPNIPVNGMKQGGASDDISMMICQATDVLYGIAVDLLLLLFILCIWRFWADAAWKGGGNLMGAVGRLIFTAGLLLAWPTIFAFEIQITNEMIKAIYFTSADQLAQLDVALATAVKGGLLATAAGIAQVFAPVLGAGAGGALGAELGGMVLGTVGDVVAYAGLIIFTILGVILIAEMVYVLILKGIQTGLLTAQYMFAPIFLVCFASPDTESYASGYVKAWIETSLWTFIWVGLFKIMVIVIYSDFNPWGKIIMAIGVLQLMIQVPSFLARALTSPMSDFISAGLVSAMAFKGLTTLAGLGGKSMNRFAKQVAEWPAQYPLMSKATDLNRLPTNAADPSLLAQYRSASASKPLGQNGAAGALGGSGVGVAGAIGGGGVAVDTGTSFSTQARAGQAVGLPQRKGEFGGFAGNPALRPAQAETEEERKKREETERQQKAARYAAALHQQRLGVVTGGTAPGTANNAAAGALNGVSAGLGRALSPAGIQRGMVDPTTTGIPDDMQGSDFVSEGLYSLPGSNQPEKRGIFNAASQLNQAYYKFVQGKIAAVNARTYNGNSIGFSDDGKNKLVGDGKGNLRHMRARKGATPEEVAHLVLAGGFTELMKDDAEAHDAARNAAIEAGVLEPERLGRPGGLSERIAAGWIGYNGGSFRETALAKQRFNRATFEQAATGSEAYVSGQSGNAYTQYLRTRFGEWTSKDDTWGVHMMTDASIAASPWNPAYIAATDSILQGGMKIDERNRAAAGNTHVMKLPAWQRKTAIPAVAAYATQMAEAQFPGADSTIIDSAVLGMVQHLSPQEVAAANAIYLEAGVEGLSVPMVQTVANLSRLPGSGSAEDVYKSLRSTMNVVGNARPRGGSGGATVRVLYDEGGGSSAQPAGIDGSFIDTGSGTPGETEIEVRPVGGSGSYSSPVQEVHVAAGGSSGGGIGRLDYAPTHNANLIERASQVVVRMYDAGMNDKQIRDNRVADLAHHFYDNHPHMMHAVSVAVDCLPPGELDVDSVHTINEMLSCGYSPGQIHRAEVDVARRFRGQNMDPSPRAVANWRQRAYNDPSMNSGPPNGRRQRDSVS